MLHSTIGWTTHYLDHKLTAIFSAENDDDKTENTELTGIGLFESNILPMDVWYLWSVNISSMYNAGKISILQLFHKEQCRAITSSSFSEKINLNLEQELVPGPGKWQQWRLNQLILHSTVCWSFICPTASPSILSRCLVPLPPESVQKTYCSHCNSVSRN